MSILIRNGTLVTASDTYAADILLENEKITNIGLDIKPPAGASIIDAKGRYVFPGFIDAHTHLDMPFGGTVTADDFQSGTVAAAHGGTTCIIDFCVQGKGQSLRQSLEIWHKKAESKAAVDYSFHIAISDLNDSVLGEMPSVIDDGITSFKCFMAYKNALMIDDSTLFRVLKTSKECGGLVSVHAENGDVIDELTNEFLKKGLIEPIYHAKSRPPECEDEATGRALLLAKMASSPIYIVHLSSLGALETALKWKQAGQDVYIETCPHYLFFDYSALDKPNFEGAKYVMSPPLRPADYPEKLWNAVVTGGIDVIATDHGSFNFKGQKELGIESFAKIPNGVPGIEERPLLIFHEGVVKRKMSLNRYVNLLATSPAKIFGLYPKKGTIAIGSDADIVVLDPNDSTHLGVAQLHHACDYSAYEGMVVDGKVEHVFLRGEQIIKEGKRHGQIMTGQFQKRKKYGM